MKYLRIIDFVGQTIIWLVLLGGALVILFSGKSWGDMAYFGIICQFFMGCWQMASAIPAFLSKSMRNGQRMIHMTLSILCLTLLFVVGNVSKEFLESTFIPLWIVVPWCLAIFYYAITWRWMFPKTYTGKFLNHINF